MAQHNVHSTTSSVLHADEVGQRTADRASVSIVIRREVRKSSVRMCWWSRIYYTRSDTVCSCRRSDSSRGYTRAYTVCSRRSYIRASLSNMSISRFLDVRFLRRCVTALILAFAVGLFIRLPGGGRSPINTASVTRRLAAVFMF